MFGRENAEGIERIPQLPEQGSYDHRMTLTGSLLWGLGLPPIPLIIGEAPRLQVAMSLANPSEKNKALGRVLYE